MTEGESAPAHEALKEFYLLGDSRTDDAVAKKLQKSCTLVRRWHKKWRWDERVDEANLEVRAIFRRETEKKAAQFADELARQRLEIAAGNFELVKLAQAKAKEVLQFVVVRDMMAPSPDGKTIVIKSNPNIRLGDAMRLLIGGNVAMNQAEGVVLPKRLTGGGKAGAKADGSPMPGGQEPPVVEFWLDSGDGTALPLTQMPEPDKLDPDFHPDDDAPTTPP